MTIQPRKWITNDAQYAAMLNDADTNFEKRKRAAQHLPLAEKIVAIREARKQLARDYDAIIAHTRKGE